MKLFVVLKNIKEHPGGVISEFHGVYDSEEKALKAISDCEQPERFLVGPAVLNKSFPEKKVEWEGAYYPVVANRRFQV